MAEAVAEILRRDDRRVEIRRTAAHGDGERIAREVIDRLDPNACVVACGGDGTIQEVVNAIAGSGKDILLGLAPAGRCNDFGRALGIRAEAQAIADVLLGGEPRRVDLGRVNGRYFCTVATAGVDAEVSDFVDGMKMPLRGTPAYLYGAMRVLMSYRCKKMQLEGDFGVIERPLLLASSANTSSYGGAIHIAPDAVPTDGMLDICFVDQMSRFAAMRLLPTLLSGKHGRRPEVHFARTRRMTIQTDTPMTLWADGERVATTPATVEVVPGAIQIMLPSSGRADPAAM